LLENNQCKMYDVAEVNDFFTQIGECHYYFHPDEILATYFKNLYFLLDDATEEKETNIYSLECDNSKYLSNMMKIMFNVTNVCLVEPQTQENYLKRKHNNKHNDNDNDNDNDIDSSNSSV
ncbi:MAG TPA: hypothetical protein VKR58_11440, partial [Aquella sp.]|nr:hypothetical protein [Aquella sp.]